MKILYYAPQPHLSIHAPTGYATHIKEMITAFELLGHEVLPVIIGDLIGEGRKSATQKTTTASPTKGKGLKQNIKKLIPNIIWESIKDVNLLRFDRRASAILTQHIQNFQPDLIYERCTYMQVSGVNAAKKFGIKHVLEVNSPFIEEQKSMMGSHSLLKSICLRNEYKQLQMTDCIAVVSSALQNYFQKKHKIPSSKFLVSPNGINLNKTHFDQKNKEDIASKYGLTGKKVIGFTGSVLPWHGVDMLVLAFDQLYAQFPNTKLIIVGGGAHLVTIKKVSSQTNVENEIIFVGNVPHKEIFDYLANMDITVMPQSNWYGSPVKIFEYGAMGKAIIAPDYIPLQDVMENDKDGMLIQPSVENLKMSLITLLQNEDKATEMAKHFQHKVLTQYQWHFIAKKVLEKISLS